MKNIDYKYNEKNLIEETLTYINSTYSEHYAGDIQTVEYIMANSDSFDFLTGSVQAYIARFGKKDGYNRRDILKAIHFCTMILYYVDKKNLSTNVMLPKTSGKTALFDTLSTIITPNNASGQIELVDTGMDDIIELINSLPSLDEQVFSEEDDPLAIKPLAPVFQEVIEIKNNKRTKTKKVNRTLP